MDPASHILSTSLIVTGWIPQGQERKKLLPPALVASLAPDLDSLSLLFGIASYSRYHETVTHNFWAVPLLIFLNASLFYFFGSYKNYQRLLTFSALGVVFHLLEDLTIDWGMAFFWPFSYQTYTLRVIFLTDPFFLMACMVGPYLNLRASYPQAYKKKLSLSILLFFAIYFLGKYFWGIHSGIILREW
ncbi:MAG: metal-dependent hydrolase [Deltaproteobacteria bacterium]|nr:metal-dependent hydrolase [Deltaproteobacteria bacterium]